jgi:plastocyanin
MIRSITGHPALILALGCILCAVFIPTPSGLQAAPPPRSIPVNIGDYRFSPDRISVLPGETIRLELTNTDSLTPHNFTLQSEAAGLAVDIDVSAGNTEVVEITPQAPGTYTFYCNKKLPFMKSHRDRGMEGTLVVGPPGPD